MKTLLYILLLIMPLFVSAQEKKNLDSPLIYVSFDKVKHIVLPAQVSDISYGREDFIKVERVEAVPNIVCITAQEEGFLGHTNLVIVCIDGSVHSFRIAYIPADYNDDCDNIIYVFTTDYYSIFYR